MGARDRSALPCAAERRRGPLPRVDRAARAQPRGGRARAQPAPLRGVAATREPAHGRARAPARRPRELQPHGSRSVRRARPPRAARHRRDRAPDHRGHARRPDAPGDPGRAVGPRRAHQPRDRRPAVHQPAHGRVPPAQGLPQARCQQPQGASPRARGHRPNRPSWAPSERAGSGRQNRAARRTARVQELRAIRTPEFPSPEAACRTAASSCSSGARSPVCAAATKASRSRCCSVAPTGRRWSLQRRRRARVTSCRAFASLSSRISAICRYG